MAAGIAIGATGTALAASSYYWTERGASYRCQGIASSVECVETNYGSKYGVEILPKSVIVTYRQRVIFGCERRFTPVRNCEYFGR